MKKTLILSFLLTLAVTLIQAQPTGYYNGTEGKQGDELKSALNDIISGHTVYTYYFSKEIFKLSDADPNNPGNVIQIYTGRSWPNNDYGNGGDQLNREHIWAKSHGNFSEVQPMDGDVHNLKPIDASVNADKSNLDYDNGGTQHPEATGCYYSENNWEPRDQDKGDVARIIFYMDTRYEGENGELNLTVVDELNTYPYPEHGKLSTLLLWNLMDPPDDFERNRNNVIYSFQHNRNPFIDNPQFAELIWNNASLGSVTIADVYQVPEVPEENEAVTIHATITSSDGSLSDATLKYGTSWSNLNNTLDMEGSGSELFAEIPGQLENTTIYYQIIAEDDNGIGSSVVYSFFVPETFSGTITSIYDIQGQAESSPLLGQVVSTTGIVTANFGTNYFLQNGPGAWNGLFIYDPGRNPSIGDSLVLTGTIAEYYEKTELKTITGYYKISTGNALPAPVEISCIEADEPYEGVLVKVNNATCTFDNYGANFYMWTVDDGTDTLLIHNTDIFTYEPTLGEIYTITGPLDYDFDEWKIQLRLETDVLAGQDITAPLVSSVTVVADTVLKIQYSEEVETTSAEALSNYSINNDVTVKQAAVHSIIKTQVFLTTSKIPGGSFELTIQNVADLVGNVMPEAIVIPFTSTGVNDHDLSVKSIYPNPADEWITINWQAQNTENIRISLLNITGQRIISGQRSVNGSQSIRLNVEELPAGLYVVELAGENEVVRSKIMVR
jgi:endonuclease I